MADGERIGRTSSPAIRINILEPIFAEVANRGADLAGLCARNGIDDADLADPYRRVPLSRYVALFEDAARALGDPFLGLKLGVKMQPEQIGPVGFLFSRSATFEDALNAMSKFLCTLQDATRMELLRDGSVAYYTYLIEDRSIAPRQQDSEFSLACACALMRRYIGSGWTPLEFHFEHLSPYEPNLIARILGAPVRFGQPMNRIVFDAADLAVSGQVTDPYLVPYLNKHLQDLLVEARATSTFADQVASLIAGRLGSRAVDRKALAAALGVSVRTLQRRLQDEGRSLRDLLRDQRSAIAETMLSNPSVSVTDVALSLGYSNGAALSRAFKEWTGQAPSKARPH